MIRERIAYLRMDFDIDRSCDHTEGSKERSSVSASIAPKQDLLTAIFDP